MCAVLTKHGEKRMKKRVGATKGTAQSIADRALAEGLKHSDVTGSLRKYLDSLFLSHRTANNLRIFNRKVFIFSGDVLITTLNLPPRFARAEDKIKARKAAAV